jgi:hypothetical protein
MATVTGLTAAKMLEIANASIVSGLVNGAGSLILSTRGGTQVDAGQVIDPTIPGTVQQYFRGDRTWQILDKAAVGLENVTNVSLSNVNNTSDLDKPVSTAQLAADNKLAKGLVYKDLVPTTSGSVVSAVVNNIPTFTFKANRNYRLVWDFSYYATGNADSLFYCSIGRAAVGALASSLSGITVIDGRTRAVNTDPWSLQSTQYTGAISVLYNPGAADVTTQIKFLAQRVLGDDGIIIVGNSNERAQYLIFDDGMQI